MKTLSQKDEKNIFIIINIHIENLTSQYDMIEHYRGIIPLYILFLMNLCINWIYAS